jgi:hypothetical protein
MSMTDGKKTYATPSVRIGNRTKGKAGLWMYQIRERQHYDRFALSRLRFSPVQRQAKGRPLILRENPGILADVEVSQTSMLLGDSYTPPRLPAPQDWVLVL